MQSIKLRVVLFTAYKNPGDLTVRKKYLLMYLDDDDCEKKSKFKLHDVRILNHFKTVKHLNYFTFWLQQNLKGITSN